MPKKTGRHRISVLASLPILAAGSAACWSAPCAREVVPAQDSTIAYRARGNRCEGFYQRNDAATPLKLELLGVHASEFPSITLGKDVELAFRVAGDLPNGGVRELHAVSIRPRHYYAMDTQEVPRDGRFAWDGSVLAASSTPMRANQLGVYACSAGCLTQAPGTVIIPVVWEGGTARGAPREVRVAFRSSVSLVRYGFTMLSDRGEKASGGTEPGHWPAERPMWLTLPPVTPGVWALDIAADAEYSAEAARLRIRLLIPDFKLAPAPARDPNRN